MRVDDAASPRRPAASSRDSSRRAESRCRGRPAPRPAPGPAPVNTRPLSTTRSTGPDRSSRWAPTTRPATTRGGDDHADDERRVDEIPRLLRDPAGRGPGARGAGRDPMKRDSTSAALPGYSGGRKADAAMATRDARALRSRRNAHRRRQRLRVGPPPRQPGRRRPGDLRGAQPGVLRPVPRRHARAAGLPRLPALPALAVLAGAARRSGTPQFMAVAHPADDPARRPGAPRSAPRRRAGDRHRHEPVRHRADRRGAGHHEPAGDGARAGGRPLHRPRGGHAVLPRRARSSGCTNGWRRAASGWPTTPRAGSTATRPTTSRSCRWSPTRWPCTRTSACAPTPTSAAGRSCRWTGVTEPGPRPRIAVLESLHALRDPRIRRGRRLLRGEAGAVRPEGELRRARRAPAGHPRARA